MRSLQQRLRRLYKGVRILAALPANILHMLVNHFPGPIGPILRYWVWKPQLKFLGKGVRIEEGVYFQNPQSISIDDNAWIDRGVIIMGGPDRSKRQRRLLPNADFPLEKGQVYIGKRVHIAPQSIISGIGGVYISDDCGLSSGFKAYSFSHHFRSDDDPSDRSVQFNPLIDHSKQYMIEGAIFLGANVGVALNVVVLPGVSIGKDSFVTMSSVVTSSFKENSLLSGTPARRVKNRYRDPE
ncbi:hypothetical protein K2Z83_24225 [Oscillochloris sp. ZM17-4]|uniref:acyltransferase n=1 Tax=Oscillochloris sp. ZM17-4 TaxID=2866714 RepID=UPI001C737F91|nr:acyltransferase [Oscillochloris sp. ZM17-4]MBX0330768.1 hypothetical protein [Oscillochloris sp. ZM17-4]